MTVRISTGLARRAVLGAALALSLPLAACGSDSSGGGGPDPATAVPAKAPMYLNVTVRPEGDLKDNTLEVAGKLLNTKDPQAEFKKLLTDAGSETNTAKLNYDEDLKPWLGQEIGLFFTKLSEGDDSQGALVLQTTDTGKAQDSLDKQLKQPSKPGQPTPTVKEIDYNGEKVQVASDDSAAAVVDDLALIGSVSGVKAAVDALKSDGGSLADSSTYKKAVGALADEDETIGSVYLDIQGTFDQVAASGELDKSEAVAARQALSASGFDSVAMGLSVEENALRVDVASPLKKAQPDLGDPSKTVASMPGDAWFAAGVGDIQKVVENQLNQLSTVTALGGADVNTLIEQLNRQLGTDIRGDLLAWMGEGAVFVRGTNLADIGGALVVQVKDTAKAKASLPTIQRLIKTFAGQGVKIRPLSASGVDAGFTVQTEQIPLPINVALAGDKFIVAVTDTALAAAIKPTGTLADNAGFKDAADALGDGIQPGVYLGFRPVLDLVEGFGAAEDPDYKQVKPTLDQLQALAAGANSEDDISRQRIVLTLND